jgi:outer membrane protein assembly factor BamC
MMDRFTRSRWLAVAGAVLLSGCSWSSSTSTSDKVAYETAQQSRTPLEVPPDLSQLPRDERFLVPERPQTITASGQQQAARPAAVGAPAAATAAVVPSGVVARIERAGDQRWLAVNLPPERVWPVLVEFWPSVGMQVEKSDAATGVLETVWAENRAKLPQDIIRRTLGRVLDSVYSTGEMDKYRARVERTAQNTSEIFVSHRGMIEVYVTAGNDQTKWQARPSDPELEAEILQRLLVKFDASAAQTAAATAAGPAGGSGAATRPAGGATTAATAAPRMSLIVKGPDGRSERLEINDGFERAWRRIGLALDRGSFTVEDRDRAKGIYFVRYLDPDYEAKAKSEQGFFSKIFTSDKPVPALQYRVVVTGESTNRTVVTVLGASGAPERSTAGDRILSLIADQLR